MHICQYSLFEILHASLTDNTKELFAYVYITYIYVNNVDNRF